VIEVKVCKSIGCGVVAVPGTDFCHECEVSFLNTGLLPKQPSGNRSVSHLPKSSQEPSMAEKYPKYYKDVSELSELDVYQVHHLFQVQDCSGAIQHASKKLLLSGVRTGGKSAYHDIKEARDTLTRWLQINQEPSPI
jgi:hypothetical protein